MALPELSVVSPTVLDDHSALGDHSARPLGLLLLAAQTGEGGPKLLADERFASLTADLTTIGFSGNKDELVRLPSPIAGASGVAVIGLGRSRDVDALRYAIGSAIRQLAGTEIVTIAIDHVTDEELSATLEGAALGSYAFGAFRSDKSSVKQPVAQVAIVSTTAAESLVEHAQAVGAAVHLVKDLVNTPASHLYPERLADAAIEAASGLPVEVTVWDESKLHADGFGGILGVGQGSVRPPRLVKLAYSPAGATKHLALVGKGITFDSGGLSLKPPVPMVGMKYDMTGAATVLAVLVAVAKLRLPVRVTAWMCIAENMPSGSALRPNDVLTIRNGTTVEVLNTDAEGRLVLADGLSVASEEQPDAIVDVATLTGAAMIALGSRYAAVMGDDDLIESVRAAAKGTGELFWQMPLPEELRATLNSDVADIANANPGNSAGGMLLAAEFLREFVGKRDDEKGRIPWAHLDIAGPAKGPASPYGFTGKGATGVTVRTLIRLAEDISRG
jgi:leucyl aminopeptidase